MSRTRPVARLVRGGMIPATIRPRHKTSCTLSYPRQFSRMTETLTIRLGTAQRKALRARATSEGKTESDVVRELIDVQLRAKGTLGERAGKHLGSLDFAPAALDHDPWRAHLRKANVRP